MKGKISIQNHSGNNLVLDIEGVIGIPEQMQFEEAGDRISTYSTLWNLLDRLKGHSPRSITVNIRSTGGSVSDALLIYDFLKSCGAEITTTCYGYAASAATIIAQAASPGKREISANCLYLVHNSSCETEGNRMEMESAAGLLRKTDERIAAIYALNSGRGSSEFTALMGENGGRGRWLSPEEVIGLGLADTIVDGGRLGRKDRRFIKNLGLPPIPGNVNLAEHLKNAGEKIRQALITPFTADRTRSEESAGESGLREESGKTEYKLPEKEIITKEEEPGDRIKPIDRMAPANGEMVPDTPVNRRAEEPDIRKTILPTTTKPKEDPSVYGQKASRNEEAYLEDIRKIRTV